MPPETKMVSGIKSGHFLFSLLKRSKWKVSLDQDKKRDSSIDYLLEAAAVHSPDGNVLYDYACL